jgi:hypothetical protein
MILLSIGALDVKVTLAGLSLPVMAEPFTVDSLRPGAATLSVDAHVGPLPLAAEGDRVCVHGPGKHQDQQSQWAIRSVYEEGVKLWFEDSPVFFMITHDGPRAQVISPSKGFLEEALVEFLIQVAEHATHCGGGTVLHASAVDVPGLGIIALAGARKTGKTTTMLQALNASMGAFVANDELLVFRHGLDVWCGGVPESVRIRKTSLPALSWFLPSKHTKTIVPACSLDFPYLPLGRLACVAWLADGFAEEPGATILVGDERDATLSELLLPGRFAAHPPWHGLFTCPLSESIGALDGVLVARLRGHCVDGVQALQHLLRVATGTVKEGHLRDGRHATGGS